MIDTKKTPDANPEGRRITPIGQADTTITPTHRVTDNTSAAATTPHPTGLSDNTHRAGG